MDLPMVAMTIDGRRVTTARTMPVYDPATGAVAGFVPVAGREHVDELMAAMSRAAVPWAATSVDLRSRLMSAAADVVADAADELADLSTAELGAPLAFSRRLVDGLVGAFRYFAGAVFDEEVLADDGSRHVVVSRRPIGPVVAITPWNGPLYMLGIKLAPALAAGNPVVVKPSPFTPLATLRVGELLREVLPPGVLNVVAGEADLGAWLVEHPTPRMITFTGSIATGAAIARAAASDFKRVTLEMGGNDPAIVLDDADVESCAPRLYAAAFTNSGQVCLAVKRVFVPSHLHDRLCSALAEEAGRARLGSGRDSATTMGPVQNGPHRARLHAMVEEATGLGAKVFAGGILPEGPGYFYPPTVIGNATPAMRVVADEQFGPVLPVVPYTDLQEALHWANAGEYGLGGSVWSADPDRAAEVADELHAGQVWINTHQATTGFDQPLVGLKHSGLGVEKGRWGLDEFTELRVRYLDRAVGPS